MKNLNLNQKAGFTIVELLTVMGVIAILIGLLVPALNLVHDYAKEIQQRGQFHSIEVAIELYKTEFGSYPPSNDNSQAPAHPVDATPYCGANKLAEALVGLDMLGFHPNSDFRADGRNTVIDKTGTQIVDQDIYYGVPGVSENTNWQTLDENYNARKGPFIDLENANVYRMTDLWADTDLASFRTTDPISLVLCDVFQKKRVSGKKTGMPVLYFRARTQFNQQDLSDGTDNDIYNYYDNANIIDLQTPDDPPVAHQIDDQKFEDMILNKKISEGGFKRPYRAGTYILLSAGKDGIYGTGDDIFNFKKEE